MRSLKNITLLIAITATCTGATAALSYNQNTDTLFRPSQEELQARKDFNSERFGIFIHWGIYSMFGQGEWFMNNKNVNYKEYAKAASAFYPHKFNAEEWVKAIKNSGAKYICFTSRHHDGFSMFATKASSYNIVDATPYGKDIVKSLADECHKQGITLNLYYSLLDWRRQDYPIGATGHGTGRIKGLSNMKKYTAFMETQLRELLSNYGKIGAIWFDGWWDHKNDKERFDWHLDKLYTLIHRLQPGCLVANNHHVTPMIGEDIQNFERDVPGENKAGLSGQEIGSLPLETCQTMNDSWGYNCTDLNYKSTGDIIRLLVRTAGKNANLLLNIGPLPDGTLPDEALKRLEETGEWMRRYGETIYGTKAGDSGEQTWGTTTQKGNKLYIHIISETNGPIEVPLKSKVKAVYTFDAKVPLKFKKTGTGITINAIKNSGIPDFIIVAELK